jgi:hypothetical protein
MMLEKRLTYSNKMLSKTVFAIAHENNQGKKMKQELFDWRCYVLSPAL